MNIKSIFKDTLFDGELGIYDIFSPNFSYLNPGEVDFFEFEVQEYHQMRMDLIFMEAYQLEPRAINNYLENIDIILYLNNIDNPLNIKRGLVLKMPDLEFIDNFRLVKDTFKDKNNITEKLVVPNKSTKKDSSRESFKNNDYSLPPVVLETPKKHVTIKNGKFNIGGL